MSETERERLAGIIRNAVDAQWNEQTVHDVAGAILADPAYGRAGEGVIEEIAAERRRQIEAEGWTPEHDDTHDTSELARAAACYALSGTPADEALYLFWPWSLDWWKPKDHRRDLIRAGALIVAEIERLDRARAVSERGE